MNKPKSNDNTYDHSVTGVDEDYTDTLPDDAETGSRVVYQPIATKTASNRPPSLPEETATTSRRNGKRSLVVIALVIAICAAVGVALGLTLTDDNGDQNGPKEGWLPVDELYSFDLSKDGNALVVASIPEGTIRKTLRMFSWTPQNHWQETARLALRDEHELTQPKVQVATDRPYPKILVSDSHAVAQQTPEDHPLNELDGDYAYTGLALMYTYDESANQYELTRELDYAAALAMDEFGHRLAIGTSSYDTVDGTPNVGSIEVMSLARPGDIYGSLIEGDGAHAFWGETLALSGNGRVLVAGTPVQAFDDKSTGVVRTWHWQDAIVDWVEVGTAALVGEQSQGLGHQVLLSRQGDILALTTLFTKQAMVYQYQKEEEEADEEGEATAEGGRWELMGSALENVSSMDMTSDGKRVAVVSDDETASMVQVYDWSNEKLNWVAVGDAVPGTDARLADDGTLVVQSRNADGPFLHIFQLD